MIHYNNNNKDDVSVSFNIHSKYKKGIRNKKISDIVHLFPASCVEPLLKEKGVTVKNCFSIRNKNNMNNYCNLGHPTHGCII